MGGTRGARGTSEDRIAIMEIARTILHDSNPPVLGARFHSLGGFFFFAYVTFECWWRC